MFHGIFDLPPFDTITVNDVSLLEIVRTPLAINLGVFAVFFVLLVRQHHVRTSLIAFSLAALLLITGIPYALGIITACLFIFFLSRLLKAWTDRSGSHRAPLITGWIVINAMLVACNLLVLLPFRSRMEWAEVTMFWGIAFMTLRSLHYIGQVCRGRIDPREVGSFKRFLHYLIHLPSFRFGPYQTFRQFTFEVDSCKQRINWKNTAYGLYRIGLGITKHLIIFHLIQRKFFYPEGFYGPYSTGMFEAAVHMSMADAWFFATLYCVRMYLFMSGFSDGAIGMNLIMGIRVPENFRNPFMASNVIDFWRRYHSSVSVWLRDEIFVPLGGPRRRTLCYFLAFAYCGFWHYPFLWTMLLFPVLHVLIITATHTWHEFWNKRRKNDDPLYHRARRWQLIESVPSRIAGVALVAVVFIFTCMIVFDHQYSGLTMMQRMLGWQGQPALVEVFQGVPVARP